MSPKLLERSISSEIRIKEAAHKIFLIKGFAASTVRDVAKEARTNVAMVNYYFRSKKNLFKVVMLEKVQLLFGTLAPILNDEASSLDEKIIGIVNSYIDFLTKNPDLITFIMNEARKQKLEFISSRVSDMAHKSHFMKQMKASSGNLNPVHFFMSLVGFIAFPFVARPMLLQTGIVNEKEFGNMMEERKQLIPVWINIIMATQKTGNAFLRNENKLKKLNIEKI